MINEINRALIPVIREAVATRPMAVAVGSEEQIGKVAEALKETMVAQALVKEFLNTHNVSLETMQSLVQIGRIAGAQSFLVKKDNKLYIRFSGVEKRLQDIQNLFPEKNRPKIIYNM